MARLFMASEAAWQAASDGLLGVELSLSCIPDAVGEGNPINGIIESLSGRFLKIPGGSSASRHPANGFSANRSMTRNPNPLLVMHGGAAMPWTGPTGCKPMCNASSNS